MQSITGHVYDLYEYAKPLFGRLFLDIHSALHIWFIAGFLLIGVLYYGYTVRKLHAFSVLNALKFVFPRAIYRHRSFYVDLYVFLINVFFVSTLVGSILLSVEAVLALIIKVFGEPLHRIPQGSWGAIVQFIIIATSLSFADFFHHYLLHKVGFLWRFHRGHHSAEVLNPLTQFRAHPVERVFAVVVVGGVGSVATGIALYLGGGSMEGLAVMLLAVMIIAKNILQNFRHSHIWISYGPFLNRVLISPCMHQIHHSALLKHRDKNLGQMLAVWDYLFGTLYVPQGKEEFPYGIDSAELGVTNPHRNVVLFILEPIFGERNIRKMCRVFTDDSLVKSKYRKI